MSIIIINIKPWYTDNNYNIIYYDKHWTDTTSCETADNAVSEIENRHHL